MARTEYQREYRQKRREADPEWEMRISREKRAKARDAINALKLEQGCSRCGYRKSPAALQFHHTDPTVKEHKDQIVARFVAQGRKKAALEEAAKCEVLCANCHAELHAKER